MSPELYNSMGETLITSESQAKLDECCKAFLDSLPKSNFLLGFSKAVKMPTKTETLMKSLTALKKSEVGTVPVGEGLENKYTAYCRENKRYVHRRCFKI